MQFSLQCATLLAPVWTATNFTHKMCTQRCYGEKKRKRAKVNEGTCRMSGGREAPSLYLGPPDTRSSPRHGFQDIVCARVVERVRNTP
jgi:hypothetical protein